MLWSAGIWNRGAIRSSVVDGLYQSLIENISWACECKHSVILISDIDFHPGRKRMYKNYCIGVVDMLRTGFTSSVKYGACDILMRCSFSHCQVKIATKSTRAVSSKILNWQARKTAVIVARWR